MTSTQVFTVLKHKAVKSVFSTKHKSEFQIWILHNSTLRNLNSCVVLIVFESPPKSKLRHQNGVVCRLHSNPRPLFRKACYKMHRFIMNTRFEVRQCLQDLKKMVSFLHTAESTRWRVSGHTCQQITNKFLFARWLRILIFVQLIKPVPWYVHLHVSYSVSQIAWIQTHKVIQNYSSYRKPWLGTWEFELGSRK